MLRRLSKSELLTLIQNGYSRELVLFPKGYPMSNRYYITKNIILASLVILNAFFVMRGIILDKPHLIVMNGIAALVCLYVLLRYP